MNSDPNKARCDLKPENNSDGAFVEELSTKNEWASPELKEFGNLHFVVKGISYNPLDGLSNLTP